MSLSDIDSPQAVLQALQEYDKIGREGFLEKYGFGHAREYFLEHNGNLYDSKAIMGAAHCYQFGIALTSGDFVGGKKTVKKYLARLGFKVQRMPK